MPGLLHRFLPREEGFLNLFAKQAANIHVGVEALYRMLSPRHRGCRNKADRQKLSSTMRRDYPTPSSPS